MKWTNQNNLTPEQAHQNGLDHFIEDFDYTS